ncbi:MAG: hypothetical protein J6Y71_01805 [Ruminococcus sp.]|nr:hypothetical protein [Ruminococcus sp.]
MKKEFKAIIVSASAIILSFSGCGVDETTSSEQISTSMPIASTETNTVKKTDHDIIFTLVNTKQNVNSDPELFKNHYSIKSSYISDLEQLNNNIIKPAKDYSNVFFSNNALIFISVDFANTASSPPTITKIEYNEGIIHIDTQREIAVDEAEEWWGCFLEVNKSDFEGANSETVVDIIANGLLNKEMVPKNDLEIGLISKKPAELCGIGYGDGIVVVNFTNFMIDSSINTESLILLAEDEETSIPYTIVPFKFELNNGTEFSRTYILTPLEEINLKNATMSVTSSAISCAGVPCDSFKPHPLRKLSDEEIPQH